MSTTPSATCTVPGACAGRGGPRDRAVERPVDLERRRVQGERAHPARHPRRHVAAARAARRRAGVRSRRPRPPGRRARGQSGVRTATARPRRTSMPTTGASQRISPPLDSKRRASAALSSPAPPRGHGEAVVLAEHAHQDPHQSRARERRAGCRCARRCRRGSPATPRRRSGCRPARPRESAACARSRVLRREAAGAEPRSAARTGGNGVSRPSIRASPTASHCRAQLEPRLAVARVLRLGQRPR